MELALEDYVFSTTWPEPRKRWQGPVEQIGVYAIVWETYAYVGMTVSSLGFKGRWAKHHRNLFVKKRRIASPKLKQIIKDHKLTREDFTLYALRAWHFEAHGLKPELVGEIAQAEQEEYDRLEALGFTMTNTVRPTGSGYTTVHVAKVLPKAQLKTSKGAIELAGVDERGRTWKVTGRALC